MGLKYLHSFPHTYPRNLIVVWPSDVMLYILFIWTISLNVDFDILLAFQYPAVRSSTASSSYPASFKELVEKKVCVDVMRVLVYLDSAVYVSAWFLFGVLLVSWYPAVTSFTITDLKHFLNLCQKVVWDRIICLRKKFIWKFRYDWVFHCLLLQEGATYHKSVWHTKLFHKYLDFLI